MSDGWKLPWDRNGCRKRSASAFSAAISVPADGFEITRCEPETGWNLSDHQHFHCSRCKNWLYLPVSGADIVNLRATMLDNHRWFAPYVEIFAQNKWPWVSTSARHRFAGMPESQEWGRLMQSFAHDRPRPTA